jgi:arylsulfatase A-like enzyme
MRPDAKVDKRSFVSRIMPLHDHSIFKNAERYDWLYQDVDVPEPDSLWQRGNHGPIGHELYGTSVGKRNTRRNMGHHMFVDPQLSDDAYKRQAYQRYLKKFLRCVKGVDDNVARLIKHLETTGELDNTIIIYTADQVHAWRTRLYRQTLDVRRIAANAVYRPLSEVSSSRRES